MGRFLLVLFLLGLTCPFPAIADTVSHQVYVTATVLPSPEWINLVQTNSDIRRIDLPYINLTLYQILLTDGNISLKNHPITITASAGDRTITQTSATDQSGLVKFLIPNNFTLTGPPDFNFDTFL